MLARVLVFVFWLGQLLFNCYNIFSLVPVFEPNHLINIGDLLFLFFDVKQQLGKFFRVFSIIV